MKRISILLCTGGGLTVIAVTFLLFLKDSEIAYDVEPLTTSKIEVHTAATVERTDTPDIGERQIKRK